MANPQRVMDRRPIWTARQWDGSEEFLAWIRPGLDQGLLTYDPESGLKSWGVDVAEGSWLVDRKGWYDLVPDTAAYEAKYEPAEEEPAATPGTEPASDGDALTEEPTAPPQEQPIEQVPEEAQSAEPAPNETPTEEPQP